MIKRPRFSLAEKPGGWHWNLHAPNGEIVATSESYSTRDAARQGIAAVKRYAVPARISDT